MTLMLRYINGKMYSDREQPNEPQSTDDQDEDDYDEAERREPTSSTGVFQYCHYGHHNCE